MANNGRWEWMRWAKSGENDNFGSSSEDQSSSGDGVVVVADNYGTRAQGARATLAAMTAAAQAQGARAPLAAATSARQWTWLLGLHTWLQRGQF